MTTPCIALGLVIVTFLLMFIVTFWGRVIGVEGEGTRIPVEEDE